MGHMDDHSRRAIFLEFWANKSILWWDIKMASITCDVPLLAGALVLVQLWNSDVSVDNTEQRYCAVQ
jgi:hypothetical protein